MRQILIVVLCLVATPNFFGQIKSITKEHYEAAEKNAHNKAEAMIRRVTTETTNFKEGKVDTTETMVIESFPSGDERWNSVTKRGGQIVDKLQLIYLGKYEYRKEGDTDWKKRCVKDCSEAERGGGFTISGAKELPKVQEFRMSEITINGQKVIVYLFYRVYQFGEVLNFYERKILIDSTGLIVKEESTNSEVLPSNRTSSETVSYFYNPKDVLPIQPPIK